MEMKKNCARCNKEIIVKTKNQKYCKDCRKKVTKEKRNQQIRLAISILEGLIKD